MLNRVALWATREPIEHNKGIREKNTGYELFS